MSSANSKKSRDRLRQVLCRSFGDHVSMWDKASLKDSFNLREHLFLGDQALYNTLLTLEESLSTRFDELQYKSCQTVGDVLDFIESTKMESKIGDYRFVKIGDNSISVYDDSNSTTEHPIATIRVTGYMITEKEFQMECMDWFSKNTS